MVLAAQAEPVQRGTVLAAEVADNQPFRPGADQSHLASAKGINAVCGITCPVDKITVGMRSIGHALMRLPR
jgi:hypothetical protein